MPNINHERRLMNRCLPVQEESQKYLWGRQDDKSCIEEIEDKVNSTELARLCGVFSKFWRHIDTPIFLTTTQLDPR